MLQVRFYNTSSEQGDRESKATELKGEWKTDQTKQTAGTIRDIQFERTSSEPDHLSRNGTRWKIMMKLKLAILAIRCLLHT